MVDSCFLEILKSLMSDSHVKLLTLQLTSMTCYNSQCWGVFMEYPVDDNLLLVFFIQGAYFFLTVVLCVKLLSETASRIKFFLGLLMAFVALCNLKDVVIYHLPFWDTMSQRGDWITVIDSLTVPLCGIFLLELIKPQSVTAFKFVLHLFPFVALLVAYGINSDSSGVIALTLAFTGVYSLLVCVRVIYSCKITPPNWSNSLIHRVLMRFFVFAGMWVYSCVIHEFYNDMLFYAVSGLVLYGIYHSVNKYANEACALSSLYREDVKDYCHYPFIGNFNRLMYDDCAYLDSNITISGVARLIGTNRSYLSEYLNSSCNSSFPEFINNLRLDYAEELMKKDGALSIEAISSASGFNSLQTFRRSFVKRHGVTPSKYRQMFPVS